MRSVVVGQWGGTAASYGEGYAYEAIRERIKKIIESFMAL